ncbi:MAG: ATP-binding protein [Desulfobacterales bacterium]|nr:ATP-binding protein [Desulfobacterales bacterium]
MKKKVSHTPMFVKNKNVRHFEVMMDRMGDSTEGRFAINVGPAGVGKTRTCQWYVINGVDNEKGIYIRMLKIWGNSELEFLRAICKELGSINPPHRKGPCNAIIMDSLLNKPVPVFLDEADRMSERFLDVSRDISDVTGAPFIMVGEEGLKDRMRRDTRVWSRTHYELEFQNMEIPDIMIFFKKSSELELPEECANMIHSTTDGKCKPGNFRVAKVVLLTLIQILNSKKTRTITKEITQIAIETAVQGI